MCPLGTISRFFRPVRHHKITTFDVVCQRKDEDALRVVLWKNRLPAKGEAGILCPLGTIPRFFRPVRHHKITTLDVVCQRKDEDVLAAILWKNRLPAKREAGILCPLGTIPRFFRLVRIRMS